jgi:D-glycero-D-manno-heptose 1,7-bisphosphate phosphatase
MRRAVFIDRDGTLIRDKHYLKQPEGIELFPETVPALAMLRETGLALVLVTNQSGIARGLLSEADLADQHARLGELLAGGGVALDGMYHCPHLPASSGDAPDCDCRKPRPGMLARAAAELDLTLAGSWIVGDKEADIDLALTLPLRPLLVRTGCGIETAARLPEGRAEAVVADLLAAAIHIRDAEAEA